MLEAMMIGLFAAYIYPAKVWFFMGFAYDSVRQTQAYMLGKKDLLILAAILPALMLAEGILILSGLRPVSYLFVFVQLVYSPFLGVLTLTYIHKSDMAEAFKAVPHYIVRLTLFVALIVGVGLAIAIPMVILAMISPLLILPLIIVAIFPLVYVSVRLSLVLAVLILEDLGLMDSIKRSWALTNGNFVNIFAASLLLGVVFLILQLPVIALQWGDLMRSFSQPGWTQERYYEMMANEPKFLIFITPLSGLLNGLQTVASSVLTSVMLNKLNGKAQEGG